MKMILNNKTNEEIDVTSYSRSLDVGDANVRFRLNLVFNGNYSAEGFEYLANYANVDITEITVEDDEGNEMLHTVARARLETLSENCDNNGRYGYATIAIYEINT